MEAPIIRLRKSPKAPINVVDLFWLPADGSYGNLLPKLMRIHQRVDEINRQLELAFRHWSAAMSGEISDAATRHIIEVEYIVFQMKRVADELIGLQSVLASYVTEGGWPKRVHPDSIGQLLGCEELCSHEPYSGHMDLLVALNNVHNAHKHSFLNSDTTLIGQYEPIASAIHRKGNKLDAPVEVYTLSVKDLTGRFESFCVVMLKAIRELANQAHQHEKSSKNAAPAETQG